MAWWELGTVAAGTPPSPPMRITYIIMLTLTCKYYLLTLIGAFPLLGDPSTKESAVQDHWRQKVLPLFASWETYQILDVHKKESIKAYVSSGALKPDIGIYLAGSP